MISLTHKFIFICIPKTGTTAVSRSLSKYCIKNFSDGRGGLGYGEDRDPRKHFTYSEYLHLRLANTEKIDEDYFSFAFVRNPFDRLVSQFHFTGLGWWRTNESHLKSGLEFCFKNYVKHIVAQDLPFSCHTYRARMSNQPDEDWSQLQFVDEGVDFIGRFENLQVDFNVICDRIGIPRQNLPHINRTKHKPYAAYYDDETRELVAAKYAKDIEHFGYKFR